MTEELLTARVQEDEITLTAEWRGEEPMEGSNGVRQDVWQVELRRPEGDAMSITFKMGEGLRSSRPDGPQAAEVLDCIVSDAAGYENANGFEDWADEYGYDTDSRRAYSTWEAVEAQTTELRAFLGEKYDAYLYETERDA